ATLQMLYWIGRRLSYFSRAIGFSFGDRYELSSAGLLAFLAPIIRDAVQSTTVLERLELNIYEVEIEGVKQSVRLLYSESLGRVDLLPSNLVAAMLTRIRELKDLAAEVPEFFNTLGEYLVSGDETLYVESLRTLASAMHSPRKSKKSDEVREVARYILSHAE
ncbi:MAG: hypothetical protein ABWW69_00970, partial [Pyrodictiaceae archaeon]